MSEAVVHLSKDGCQARLVKTRAEMSRRGPGPLVVPDPSSMVWLTGYDGGLDITNRS